MKRSILLIIFSLISLNARLFAENLFPVSGSKGFTDMSAVAVIDSFAVPGSSPTGMAWDGAALWIVDNLKHVYHIDTQGNVLSSFTIDFTCSGLAWDGQYLWFANESSHRIDKYTNTGTYLSNINVWYWSNSGIAFDGQYFWVANYNFAEIHKHDMNGNEILYWDGRQGGIEHPTGMTWDGEYLWIGDSNEGFENNVCMFSKTGQLKLSFNTEDYSIYPTSWPEVKALAWDGQHLWYSASDLFMVYKFGDAPPAKPQNLSAIPGDKQITLNWTASTESDFKEYRIFRGTVSPAQTLLTTVTTNFYTDEDLVNGHTYYYRMTAVDQSDNESDFSNEVSAIPEQFTEQTGISLTGVNNSSVAWGDYDNDGDLDILLTGESNSGPGISKVYRNNGNNSFTEQTGISLIGVYSSSVAWGDYDNDGDLDILLTGVTGSGTRVSNVYRNNGDNSFTEQAGISLTKVYDSSVAWGDYDNDGDLDILLTGSSSSSGYVSKIYRNNGDNSFMEQTGISLTGVNNSSVAWGDYDNDDDLDILLTGRSGSSTYVSKIYRNNGNNSFTEQTGISLTGVFHSSVAWGDYDNDGDIDLLFTGCSDWISSTSVSRIYCNNGDNSFTEQTGISLTEVRMGSVAWGDYDNDGDLDILLTGYSSSGYVSKIYRNNGDNSFTEQTEISISEVVNSSVAWGDYDNDGDLDILLTGYTNSSSRFSKIYRNNNLTPNSVPTTPSGLTASATVSDVTFSWDKSTDAETPQNGLTYNLFVSTTPGDCQIKSPMADISSGYRKVVQLGNMNQRNSYTLKGLPEGKYYWSVQAIDNGFTGSAFAPETSFTISIPPANPQNLTATSGDKQITLNWTANSEEDLKEYRIYRDISSPAQTLLTTVTTNSYTDTNVLNEQKYYYRITAVDQSDNESDFSEEVSATPVASKSVTVTSPNGGESWIVGSQHGITWTSVDILNVKIEYSTNSGTSWAPVVSSSSASPGSYNWTIPNSLSSLCKVKISDPTNASLYDTSDNMFSIVSAPVSNPVLTTLAATAVDTGSVVLHGSANADDENLTVFFDYGTSLSYGSQIAAQPTSVSGKVTTDVQTTLSGLSPNTTYHYRVRATYGGNTKQGSDQTFHTTGDIPTVYTMDALDISSSSANLNGQLNSNGLSTHAYFEIGKTTAYGQTVSGTPVWFLVDQLTDLSAYADKLDPNAEYHFRFVGVNHAGRSNGLDKTFTTKPQKSAPTVTTQNAIEIDTTFATLAANVNPNSLSTTIWFEYGRSLTYGSTVTAQQSPVTGTSTVSASAQITGLSPNTIYHFRVVAENDSGRSEGLDKFFFTLDLPQKPEILLYEIVSIDTGSVAFSATVHPHSFSTEVSFEYGLSQDQLTGIPADQGTISGQEQVAITAAISGLVPNQTYSYRIKVMNAIGTGYSDFETFHTLGSLPEIVTNSENAEVTMFTAQLFAGINPKWLNTHMRFEYGMTGSYGSQVQAEESPVTHADSAFQASKEVSGLEPATTYHYRAVAKNQIGTVNGPDRTFTTLADTIPPVVATPDFNPQNPNILEDIVVTVDVTDNYSLADVTLEYCRGGNGAEQTITMNNIGGPTFQGNVPAVQVTDKGIAIRIVARDHSLNTSYSAYYSFELQFLTLASNIAGSYFENGLPKDQWGLFSIPADLSSKTIQSVLGDELGEVDANKWRIFAYRNGQFVDTNLDLNIGEGYWLCQRNAEQLQIQTADGTTAELTQCDITLKPGWNLIGNPYTFALPINLNPVQFYGPLGYQIGGTQGWTDVVSALDPWGGYAVYNRTPSDKIITLTPLEEEAASKSVSDRLNGWKLRLEAHSAHFTDPGNYIGRVEGASEDFDVFDNPEPFSVGNYISLSIPHPEWRKGIQYFNSDIRSSSEENGIWELALTTAGEEGPVRIRTELLGKLPDNLQVLLFDPNIGKALDLRETGKEFVISRIYQGLSYKFSVIAGDVDFTENTITEMQAQLPSEFRLTGNYPNPFNPGTMITYELPAQCRVSLIVYDITGREIRKLVDSPQEMGRYRIAWDGIDNRGMNAAAGLYLCRLISDQDGTRHATTQKMIKLK